MLSAREDARETAYETGGEYFAANPLATASQAARESRLYSFDAQLQRDFLDGFDTARDSQHISSNTSEG